MTRSAILGSTGFVGSTIAGQLRVTEHYHSRNIDTLSGTYDQIICAAAPGMKWLANEKPEEDWAAISSLLHALRRVTVQKFILISTVDVFDYPVRVDETTPATDDRLAPYGKNRLRLENEINSLFDSVLVVRLPALVGRGLRKNVLYDLHNANNLESVDSRSVFQFYPMVNLWKDISIGIEQTLKVLHLTAVPTSVEQVSRESFGQAFHNELPPSPAKYDLRSIYGQLYGVSGHYQYSSEDVFQAARSYHETEPYCVGDGQ